MATVTCTIAVIGTLLNLAQLTLIIRRFLGRRQNILDPLLVSLTVGDLFASTVSAFFFVYISVGRQINSQPDLSILLQFI